MRHWTHRKTHILQQWTDSPQIHSLQKKVFISIELSYVNMPVLNFHMKVTDKDQLFITILSERKDTRDEQYSKIFHMPGIFLSVWNFKMVQKHIVETLKWVSRFHVQKHHEQLKKHVELSKKHDGIISFNRGPL